MRILAASLIDGENISPKYADDLYQIFSHEKQHGVSIVARLLIGNPQALKAWSSAAYSHHFQTRTHEGGRNAADYLLRDEALKLAQQGVKRFYLVSNDRGFAGVAGLLQTWGCQVIGLGTATAAKQWRESCDLFAFLGTAPNIIGAAIADAFERHSFEFFQGDIMEPFSSLDPLPLPDGEKTREALQAIYGSATQPPLLTNLLFLFLQHAFTALCLTEQESMLPERWSARWDREILVTTPRDPIISVLLEQDSRLRSTWQTVTAFAYRCSEAYEQGRAAARLAFPGFPRHCVSALQQEHLATLEASWRYHAAPEHAQCAYPGFTPDAEQKVLLRWFRRGYLSGAQEETQASEELNERL